MTRPTIWRVPSNICAAMSEASPDRTVAPPLQSVPAIALPPMTSAMLASGAELKIYDKSPTDVVQLSVVREGGLAEIADPAAAQLFGATLREGSAHYSAGEIAETLDFNGAWLNASVLPHHHLLKFYALRKRLPEVLPVVNDILRAPAFAPEAVERHRESQAGKLEVALRKVKFLADRSSQLAAYGAGHPLVRDVTPDAIRAVRRDDLLAVAGAWREAPATIYLSGKVTDSVAALVESAFGDLPCGRRSLIRAVPLSPAPPGSTRRTALDGASQCAVAMTLPAVSRSHPDYLMLHTAVAALGGYFGSRLMSVVREEKGYTYGISAGLLGQIDGAFISIGAECDPRFVGALIEEVRTQMLRLAEEPPAGDELVRLRQALASGLLEVLETPFTIADYHSTMQTQGIADGYFDSRVRLLRSLEPRHIAAMAERYLRPELLTVSIAGQV